jgi:hypothetical protein
MPFLILDIGEGRHFDKRLIVNALANLKGATPRKRLDNHLVFYRYETADDSTTIALENDLETISIDGSGKASLFAALHIQLNYPEDIQLYDEVYSFHIVLRGVSSLRQLEQRITAAGG